MGCLPDLYSEYVHDPNRHMFIAAKGGDVVSTSKELEVPWYETKYTRHYRRKDIGENYKYDCSCEPHPHPTHFQQQQPDMCQRTSR